MWKAMQDKISKEKIRERIDDRKKAARERAVADRYKNMPGLDSSGLPFRPIARDKWGAVAAKSCLRISALAKKGPRSWQRWLCEQVDNPSMDDPKWIGWILYEYQNAGIKPEDYPNERLP